MSAQPSHIENLFTRARTGDDSALEQYCDLARRGLLLIARRELPSHSESSIEDIVHDTLEAFIQRRDQISGSSASYLRGILFNKINTELRRKYTGVPFTSGHHDHEDTSHSFEHSIELRDRVEYCLRVISRLEEPDRTLLHESLKGTSVDGIWEWYLTVNPSSKFDAFKKRLYRARQRLWVMLEEDGR